MTGAYSPQIPGSLRWEDRLSPAVQSQPEPQSLISKMPKLERKLGLERGWKRGREGGRERGGERERGREGEKNKTKERRKLRISECL